MKVATQKQQSADCLDYPPEAEGSPQKQGILSRGFTRLMTPGKWLERAVLFLCLAIISAVAGFLGSGTEIFNGAWMISTLSLLLGVISLFLDNNASS